jgi:signal transduction histidine kinase
VVTGTGQAPLWHRRPVAVDVVFLSIVWLVDLALASEVSGAARTPLQALVTALALLVVPLRHRLPLPTHALAVVGFACVVLVSGRESLAVLAPLLTLYSVGLANDRTTTALVWAGTVVVLAPVVALRADRLEEALSVLPWSAAAAAVGHGVRNRRSLLAALQDRALRAEQSREEEALRRVAEERVRIARDLHDVVAHHIAVVSVQAGTAQHLMTADPAAAAVAVGEVRRAAGQVLDELKDLLYVLRQPGEPQTGTAPVPGLARLDALVASFTSAGLSVEWTLHGGPRELPATVDLVAYRLLEEALTNALKHGTGSARVDVEHRDTSLRLRVVNPVRPAAGEAGRTGHGLLGMRERAAAVGAVLDAGPVPGGAFRVEATLPLHGGRP